MAFLTKRLIFMCCGLVFVLAPGQSAAQQELAQITNESFDRTASTLVLEYTQVIPLLGPGIIRRARFFGDGTVELDFAPPHVAAGNHLLSIDPLLIEQLATTVVTAEILQSSIEEAPPENTLQVITDSTFTTITLELNSYMNATGEEVLLSGPMIFSEENVSERIFVQDQFQTIVPEYLVLLNNVVDVVNNLEGQL